MVGIRTGTNVYIYNEDITVDQAGAAADPSWLHDPEPYYLWSRQTQKQIDVSTLTAEGDVTVQVVTPVLHRAPAMQFGLSG